MKKYLVVLSLFALIGCNIDAQYDGYSYTPKAMSITDIKADAAKLDRKDVIVQLTGNIIEKKMHEIYVFQDATGTIFAEIDDKLMLNLNYTDKTKLEIIAEVDYESIPKKIELEVKSIKIIE